MYYDKVCVDRSQIYQRTIQKIAIFFCSRQVSLTKRSLKSGHACIIRTLFADMNVLIGHFLRLDCGEAKDFFGKNYIEKQY